MRQSLKVCVLVAAASGALGASGAAAYVDAGATGLTAHSAGVLSGNSIYASVHNPAHACGDTLDGAGALRPARGAWCGKDDAPAPAAQRPPMAPRHPVAHRRVAEPARHRAPEPARHRAPAPARPAPERAPQDHRVGAVARAGASAGSALLASAGAEELVTMAGLGGGLLLGGALLLRRGRSRRR
ncbi:chaplin [Streptomyces sp. NPDC002446]